MLHFLHLYNEEILILAKGLEILTTKLGKELDHDETGTALALTIKIRNIRGQQPTLYTTQEAKIMFSAISALEYSYFIDPPEGRDGNFFRSLGHKVKRAIGYE